MSFTSEHLAGHPELNRRIFADSGISVPGIATKQTIRHRSAEHQDRNPSLSVDLDEGVFNCFGCGDAGDAVSAFARAHGMNEAGAIAEMRQRYEIPAKGNGHALAGIPPPQRPPPDAAGFWSKLAKDDADGVAYLRGRNLWPAPVKFAAGDTFRIAAPLYDAGNRIVNVQRRPAAPRADVSGAPFLPIRGAQLSGTSFGLLEADGPVWLVEGMTDWLAASLLADGLGVIPLGAPGVSNVAALVSARFEALKDRTVYVSMDNDPAGEKASLEALDVLTAAGVTAVAVKYPAGFKDLADVVEAIGVEKASGLMAELLRGSTGAPAPDAQVVDAAGRKEPDQPWVVVGADEFSSMVFPERQYLLNPWFQEKNLALLYAPRGVGKTIVSAGIALAVSCGGQFLRWNAPRPRRVLYIDGELPQETLQKRLRDVAMASGLAVTGNLRLLTPDLQPAGVRLPNLADLGAQEAVENLIDAEDPDLIVLDNLSTLCRGGEENSAESWQVIQDWLVLLRSRRRSVLLDHHSGKSGDQRGTSKREDVLDISIRLTRPSDYQQEQGARFEVHFEKSRDPHGDAVAPFEAWLERDAWTVKALTAAMEEKMIRLAEEGLSTREIGKQVGKNHSTVARALGRAKADGRMKAALD